MSIIFDQLRISNDGKQLYIDMHVSDAEYFTNVYLDDITIVTADKVSETNPKVPTEDYIYYKKFDGNLKSVSLVLPGNDLNWTYTKADLSKELFFVYVKWKGTMSLNAPCGADEAYVLGVAADTSAIYQTAMNYTKELADTCSIPDNFIDFILNFNAFKVAIDTGHYVPAINFWKQLMNGGGRIAGSNYSGNRSKVCGCHG